MSKLTSPPLVTVAEDPSTLIPVPFVGKVIDEVLSEDSVEFIIPAVSSIGELEVSGRAAEVAIEARSEEATVEGTRGAAVCAEYSALPSPLD